MLVRELPGLCEARHASRWEIAVSSAELDSREFWSAHGLARLLMETGRAREVSLTVLWGAPKTFGLWYRPGGAVLFRGRDYRYQDRGERWR